MTFAVDIDALRKQVRRCFFCTSDVRRSRSLKFLVDVLHLCRCAQTARCARAPAALVRAPLLP